jgi:hypothetical protein
MRMNQDFERLATRLLAGGMPPGQVRRYLTELSDHRVDLLEEAATAGLTGPAAQTHADHRLGTPRQLAAAALKRHRRGTFCGRHAWLFFGIWPIFSIFFLWLAILFGVGLLGHWLINTTDTVNHLTRAVTPHLCAVLDFSVPFLMALWFYRAARRRALAAIWWLFPCGYLLLCAASMNLFIHVNPDGHTGSIALGAAFPRPQALLPLCAAVLCFAFTRRRKIRRFLAGV